MRSIALLSAASFASVATMRIADPLLPEVAAEFHVSIGQAAIIGTAFTVAYGVFQLIFGLLGERFDKYRIVAAAATASALTSSAAAFADTLNQLALLRLVSGATAAGIIPTAMAYIGDAVPYERRQATLAGLMSGSMLGVIAGQVLGGLFAGSLGWRHAFLALSLAYLAIAALLWWQARGPGPERQPGAKGPSLGLYLSLLRTPASGVLLLAVFVEGFLFYGGFVFFGAYLRHDFGLDYWAIGLTLGAFGIGGLIYAAGARRLIALLAERGISLAGGIIMAGGFLGLGAGPSWTFGILVALTGWGFCAFHTTLQVNATQMAPHARGQAMGLFSSCLFCGQAAGIALCGALVDRLGYPRVFEGLGLLLLVLALAFRRALPRRPRHP